jgi:hypothetical protein
VKGWKALGNKITYDTFKSAKLLSDKVGIWLEETKSEESSDGPIDGDDTIIIDELDGQKTLF